MQDYFYKFLDKAQMLSMLESLGMTYTDDNDTYASQGNHQYAAWVVGEMESYAGYHYNLRLIDEAFDVSSLEPYLVFPQNPKVIWS